MTIIWDSENDKIIKKFKNPPLIDGEKIELEPPLWELEYIVEPMPEYDYITQKISRVITKDLENKIWTESWTIENKGDYEIAVDDWVEMDWQLRINAPVDLILTNDTTIKFWAYFNLKKFPIIVRDDRVLLYCNSILDEHLAVLDSFSDVIKLETRPLNLE